MSERARTIEHAHAHEIHETDGHVAPKWLHILAAPIHLDPKDAHKRWLGGYRQMIYDVLHNHKVHYTLLMLLVADLLLVVIGLLVEIQALHSEVINFEHQFGEPAVIGMCDAYTATIVNGDGEAAAHHQLEETIHGIHQNSIQDADLINAERGILYASVAILSVLLMENLLLLFVGGYQFFTHPLHLIDFCLIVVSIALESHAAEQVDNGSASYGLLAFGRAWRFLRIFTTGGVAEIEINEAVHEVAHGSGEHGSPDESPHTH